MRYYLNPYFKHFPRNSARRTLINSCISQACAIIHPPTLLPKQPSFCPFKHTCLLNASLISEVEPYNYNWNFAYTSSVTVLAEAGPWCGHKKTCCKSNCVLARERAGENCFDGFLWLAPKVVWLVNWWVWESLRLGLRDCEGNLGKCSRFEFCSGIGLTNRSSHKNLMQGNEKLLVQFVVSNLPPCLLTSSCP